VIRRVLSLLWWNYGPKHRTVSVLHGDGSVTRGRVLVQCEKTGEVMGCGFRPGHPQGIRSAVIAQGAALARLDIHCDRRHVASEIERIDHTKIVDRLLRKERS